MDEPFSALDPLIRREMQRTMQAHCAVFRTDELMTEGVDVEYYADDGTLTARACR